jgi:hypothetical protein
MQTVPLAIKKPKSTDHKICNPLIAKPTRSPAYVKIGLHLLSIELTQPTAFLLCQLPTLLPGCRFHSFLLSFPGVQNVLW